MLAVLLAADIAGVCGLRHDFCHQLVDGLLIDDDFHGRTPFFCIQWLGLESFPCPLLCL